MAGHVEVLERCFLIRRLAPLEPHGRPVQKARHRVFVTDTTLRNAQMVRDAWRLTEADELRRVVATSLVRHVVERFSGTLARVGYWRDARTRTEADVVVHNDEGVVVFHNLYDRPTDVGERDGVVRYCREIGARRAVLVTRDASDVGVFRMPGHPTEFVKVPAHVAMYLLGRAECQTRV